MKVGLATVSWRGPGSVLEPGKVSREVKWSGMGLGWCAVVPALTDFSFRCIPTNDHPNTGHPEGFDHQDDHCTQYYYQGDGIEQQGRGWGVWRGGTCGERAGAGGAREWGAGGILRAG